MFFRSFFEAPPNKIHKAQTVVDCRKWHFLLSSTPFRSWQSPATEVLKQCLVSTRLNNYDPRSCFLEPPSPTAPQLPKLAQFVLLEIIVPFADSPPVKENLTCILPSFRGVIPKDQLQVGHPPLQPLLTPGPFINNLFISHSCFQCISLVLFFHKDNQP